MLILTPPLSVIEANLFDSPLSGAEIDAKDEALRLEADAQAEAAVQQRSMPGEEGGASVLPSDLSPGIQLPAHLAAKIRQRVACQGRGWPLRPEPGLIVRVDRASGPDGPTSRLLSQPLAVLLSTPAQGKDLWEGWLMGWETDYACDQDLLLEEQDEPYDPMAAMVQTWNPVTLYWPTAGAVLGRLSAERLAAVRELAQAGGIGASAEPGRPGTLVLRTTPSGRLVLTGTPLGDSSDPRWRYRQLYFTAAGLVRQTARQVSVAAPARPWWQRVIESLQEGTRVAGLTLAPVPMPALGANEPELASPWRLEDWVEWRLIPAASGDSVRIQLRLLQQEPLEAGLMRGEQTRQRSWLTPDQPQAELIAGADQGLTLFIRDAAGKTRLLLPLDR